MEHILENEFLKIKISDKGAELQEIIHKKKELNYLWNGDQKYWGKHSPVLFPIVGSLKNNTFFYHEKPYQLSRHGFARDADFSFKKTDDQAMVFSLKSSEETKKKFPFDFEFQIIYTLLENKLGVSYRTINLGNEDMYFSVGAHPAFNIPFIPHTIFEDYFLDFSEKENSGIFPLNSEGLLQENSISFLDNQSEIPLRKSLFDKDALVFSHLKSNYIYIKHKKEDSYIRISLSGMPYLGIWSAKDAPFVCIEPWNGIADFEDSNQKIEDKKGIILLKPKAENFCGFELKFG